MIPFAIYAAVFHTVGLPHPILFAALCCLTLAFANIQGSHDRYAMRTRRRALREARQRTMAATRILGAGIWALSHYVAYKYSVPKRAP